MTTGNRPGAVYEQIGTTYATTRVEDPRVATVVHGCLGDGERVVNVGAGTGNYEPADRWVVAVEPSPTMLRQRVGRSERVVRATAEALPLPAASFDVAMAILTLHHWTDIDAGLRELQRVAARQVIFFYEPLAVHDFWAIEYFPEALDLPTEQRAPGLAEIGAVLEVREVVPVLVPHDCTDGFGNAFWARPEAMLRPEVQAGMSWLAFLPEAVRERGTAHLRDDLRAGRWDDAHGHLRTESEFDGGYRIAVCGD